MKKAITFLCLLMMVALSSHAAYYIVGNIPFGDWNPAVGVEMTPQSDGTYQCKATINGTIWFVFADGLDADWTVFNSTYRIGPLNGDETVHLDTYVTTQRAGDTGAYKFIGSGGDYTITLNPYTWKFIIDGIYYPLPVTYTVAGSSTALFGTEWDPSNKANDMEELDDGTYRWQKHNVRLEEGAIEFKVVANRDWGMAYPPSNFYAEVTKAGNYDVDILFDPSSEEVSCSIVLQEENESSLHGDLNRDGEINLADVNVLIDAILTGNMDLAFDVNEDREINLADVSALIDILLNPAPKELKGSILLDWSDDDGQVSVQYTGNEKVTMTVIVNGVEEELTNGCFYLTDYGYYTIDVIVSAPGYNDLTETFSIIWPIPEPTPMPDIYVEITEDCAIISALGEGAVHLYIDGDEVDNPCYYERGDEDVEILIMATARRNQSSLISEPAYMQLVVPAKEEPIPEPTPAPNVTIDVNDDAVVINVEGEGEIHVYVDGIELDWPYTIERGDVDMDVLITVTAQADGMEMTTVEFEYTIPAKGGVDPEDPHSYGHWLVLIDKYGNEVWYSMTLGNIGDYVTTFSLKNDIFGDWDGEDESTRPNVPFYVVVDGVRYGPEDNNQTPVIGSALDNPLFEGSNYYVIPFGYTYSIGILYAEFDGNMYLAVARAWI